MYTTEQILDNTLKVSDGESLIEVKQRFINCFYQIINSSDNNRIAIVSHGAAIKFFLLNFLNFDIDERVFKWGNKVIANEKLNSPAVIKLILNRNNELMDILSIM